MTSLLTSADPDLPPDPFFPSVDGDERLIPSEGLPGLQRVPLTRFVSVDSDSYERCLFRKIMTTTITATPATMTTPTILPIAVAIGGMVVEGRSASGEAVGREEKNIKFSCGDFSIEKTFEI